MAREPQIAIDAGSRVAIAYGLGNTIYVSISRDRGASFGSPIKIADAGQLSLGMRRGPRIASTPRALVVTAVYGAQGKGRDGDLVAFRSVDGGQTWRGPEKVNDVAGSAREGLHAMAAAPDGTLACVWLDLRGKGTRLYSSISKDDGATWSTNCLVYASPSGTICQCCHPSLAFDDRGKLYAMFRNSLGGDRDMYLTSSTDYRNFTPATKLGKGSWKLDACPMDGGMLAIGKGGQVVTTWRREGTVYTCGLVGEEVPLGPGKQAWIATSGSKTTVVWQEGSNILCGEPANRTIRPLDFGDDPVITCHENLMIAAWNSNGVRAARLP